MNNRRKTLRYLLGAMTGSGIAATSIPFIKYMNIAADKEQPTFDIDISGLNDGELMIAQWFLIPRIVIIKRTPQELESINEPNPELLDPNSEDSMQPDAAKNQYRSIRPEIFVSTGACTHLGCSTTYQPDAASAVMGLDWRGGFFCPCHGSKYDISGRVFKHMPAPRNMDIPNHEYIDENIIRIKYR